MAKIHRSFTLHLFAADGSEPFEPTGLKTLELARQAALSGFENEPSVAHAVITVDRFNGSFYAFEKNEVYIRS